jgi:hypothetical protein
MTTSTGRPEETSFRAERIRHAFQDAADVVGIDVNAFRDHTLRQAFQAAERHHTTVYWGCWTEPDLTVRYE